MRDSLADEGQGTLLRRFVLILIRHPFENLYSRSLQKASEFLVFG